MQDSYGNTVLHMLVIRDEMVSVELFEVKQKDLIGKFRICLNMPFDIIRKKHELI